MFRIALVVWIMLGTALAGTAMLAVLIVPDLAAQAMKNIPLAVTAGFAAAMPLSYLVARKIGSSPGSIRRKRACRASLPVASCHIPRGRQRS